MKLGILMKQDLKNLMTNPTMVLFCFVYPIALILLFGFLFSNIYGGNGVTSYDFYGVTMMFYIVLASSTITPITFMEQRIRKANARIAYCPVSRTEIYVSKLLSTFCFLAIPFSFDLLLFHFLGIVNYGANMFGMVWGLMIAMLIFSITLGGAVCVIIKDQEWTNRIIGVIANTLAILSGIFFPIASLGQWADMISNISPLKWVLNTIFSIIYDGNSSYFGIVLLALILLSVAFVLIIHKRYKPEDYV